MRYPFLELYWDFVAEARLGHLFVAGALLLYLVNLVTASRFVGFWSFRHKTLEPQFFCWQVQYFRECDAKNLYR